MPGPEPTLFFAPAQAQKRVQQWGGAEFHARTTAAWDAYIESVADWLQVTEWYGEDAVATIYRRLLDGHAFANSGHILSLWPESDV